MKTKEDPEREDRIEMNALVDTYSAYEAVSGWYANLESELLFPFEITNNNEAIQTVSHLCDLEEFDGDFYVWAEVENDQMMVGVSDLKLVKASAGTKQVIEDWQYFCARGSHHGLTENNDGDEC